MFRRATSGLSAAGCNLTFKSMSALSLAGVALLLTMLSACSESAPDQAEIEKLFKEAEAASNEIAGNNPAAKVSALIAIATTRANSEDIEAARTSFNQAKTLARNFEGNNFEGDNAAYWRGFTLGRVGAAEARVGFDDASGATVSEALTQLKKIADTKTRAGAMINVARELAASTAAEAALSFLAEAVEAAQDMPDRWEKSWLFREAADVYKALGAQEIGRNALSLAEAGAWLEEDATSQPIELMRLAEAKARLGDREGALAIMQALRENYYPPIQAALVEAQVADGKIAAAETAASEIAHPPSRTTAYMAIAEHYLRQAAPEQAKEAALKGLAAVRGGSEETRVIRYYALADILLRARDLEGAKQTLTEAMHLNQEQGSFWNFNEFSEVNVALAKAGELDAAEKIAGLINDPEQRNRELAKLKVVRARNEARQGKFKLAHDLAHGIRYPYQRARALLAVIDGLREE